MVLDTIEKLNTYTGYCPKIQVALDFLAEHSPMELHVGRISLPEGVFLNVFAYEPKEQSNWEVHRQYIDLQYIIEGNEKIRWLPLSAMNDSTGYDMEKDVEFFTSDEEGSTIYLKSGQFVLFFPDDAHYPSVHLKSKTVHKLVFKIPV